ncbi:MAG TPA: hypothetical protein VHT30_03065 [Acidimicrobiales bacterium]|nr:hypothetical protein [Acidimicrobiales bacterium]
MLQLQYQGGNTAGPTIQFVVSDLLGDNDPELIALQVAPDVAGVQAVDVIDESGAIVAHLMLGAGGQVSRSFDPPGLEAWSGPDAQGTATESIVGFEDAQWRIVQLKHVPGSAVPRYPNGDGFV